MRKLSDLIPVMLLLATFLVLAYLGKHEEARQGPVNGLIQTKWHVWRDVPLHRQDFHDAERFIDKQVLP